MIKLTILVLTVPKRIHTFFPTLLDKILTQIGSRDDVEIIGLFDNKKRSIGEKRNNALSLANGEYLTFIDDDDDVSDDYISSILQMLYSNPSCDCLCFDCITTINGDHSRRIYSKYSIHYEYSTYGTDVGYAGFGSQWRGKPAHTMVWRSIIAKSEKYANKNFQEDSDWVKRAYPKIVNEVQFDKILYYYNFNLATSETRG